ncbi:hypothetical protein RND81_02G184600 [Saponaria officinalis]|uniref:Uncharacterized protein n=1 Tax=Saponaria officinalis TaxID=3572 RepID=A0AAW1MX67_SAPOF
MVGMEAAVWLEFHYSNNVFDYPVYDVDLMQMLDLIADLGGVALKQNVLIPDVYDLYYKRRNGVKKYIKCDRDLLGMFTDLEGYETIIVWMENTKKPIKEFQMYFDLRRAQREEQERKQREEDERRRLEMEAEMLEPLSMEIPVVDVDTNETQYVRVFGDSFDAEPAQRAQSQPEPKSAPQPQSKFAPQPKSAPPEPKNEQHQQPTSEPQPPQPDQSPQPNSQPPTEATNEQHQQPTSEPQQQPTQSETETTQPTQSDTQCPTSDRKGVYVAKQKNNPEDCRPKRNETAGERGEKGMLFTSGSEDSDYAEDDDTDSDDSDESLDEEENDIVEEEEMNEKNCREDDPHPFDTTNAVVDGDETEHYLGRVYKNGVESFNALLNDLRDKLVLTLMEGIRTYYMDKFAEMMELAERMQLADPTPYAKIVLVSNCLQSRHCIVIKAG